MSRTDLDAATLARSLRRMAGDGGMEWCCEPIQASVLLDVADMLDESAKLRELVRIMHSELVSCEDNGYICGGHKFDKRVSELGIEVDR